MAEIEETDRVILKDENQRIPDDTALGKLKRNNCEVGRNILKI